MSTKLYGFAIRRNQPQVTGNLRSFTHGNQDDGSTEIYGVGGAYYGYQYTSDPKVNNETALVTRYRELASQPVVDRAIDDIVNEAFSYDDDGMPVSLNLDDIENSVLPDSAKKQVTEEFDYLLNLMNFKTDCYDIFKRWYVDGRLFYEKVIDIDKPDEGIKQLKNIDPRKIRKVVETEFKKETTANRPSEIKLTEYFIYNPRGIAGTDKDGQETINKGIRVSKDTIAYIHSKIQDKTNRTVLSYLHKAIRPFNQLRRVEDAIVIYRLNRSAETRVFNIELGDMPKARGEEFMRKQISKIRKKPIYNSETGEVENETKYQTMMEDYWFPMRDGNGTTVDQLAAGANLGDIEDIEYFRRDLYMSLNVPVTRFESDMTVGLGRSSEITRDELKFSKFVNRLRKIFSGLFDDILGTHLILKNIVTPDEWDLIKPKLIYDYIQDNQFAEFKDIEIWRERISLMTEFEGVLERKQISWKWVRQNILRIDDEEWDEIKKDIDTEAEQSQDTENEDEDEDDGDESVFN